MIVAGVDAGKEGAAAAYDTDSKTLVDLIDLPLDSDRDLDAVRFCEWLIDNKVETAVVEDCWQPLTLVRMVGEITASAKIAGVESFNRIAVTTWKKAMLGLNTSDKKVSVERCKQLMPNAQLRKPRARTDSPDRAEAVLMALYAAGGNSRSPSSSGPLRSSP